MPPIATVHVYSVHGTGMARAVGRMATDRVRLRQAPGLRFAKLLGTGDGRSFSPRDANLRRWAMFAMWSATGDADRFDHRCGWTFADETCRFDLGPQRWRGRWSRRDPFIGLSPVDGANGPIAVVTRARVRARHWRTFAAAMPPVAAASVGAAGQRFAMAIGEAPIGLQATFSVWDDAAAVDAFAYGPAATAHREVMRRTRIDGWYAEELFARFSVLAVTGTVDGRTP